MPAYRPLLNRARQSVRACLLVSSLCAAAPAIAAGYVPTMADMMSIQAALNNVHDGADRHDDKLLASAFTEDGTYALVERGVPIVSVTGRDKLAAGGLMGAMPPPGGPGGRPGGPGAPPGGAGGPPGAPPSERAGGPPPMGEIWHFSTNDRFTFVSPTRVEHYAYWLDMRPSGERTSIVGVPGHYEDTLVKRNGEWLVLKRTIFVGTR